MACMALSSALFQVPLSLWTPMALCRGLAAPRDAEVQHSYSSGSGGHTGDCAIYGSACRRLLHLRRDPHVEVRTMRATYSCLSRSSPGYSLASWRSSLSLRDHGRHQLPLTLQARRRANDKRHDRLEAKHSYHGMARIMSGRPRLRKAAALAKRARAFTSPDPPFARDRLVILPKSTIFYE